MRLAAQLLTTDLREEPVYVEVTVEHCQREAEQRDRGQCWRCCFVYTLATLTRLALIYFCFWLWIQEGGFHVLRESPVLAMCLVQSLTQRSDNGS